LATQEQLNRVIRCQAQLDRFMFSIEFKYPSFQERVDVVKATTADVKASVNALFTAQEIIDFQI
jgi:MoxR-like ATPase